MISLGCVDSNVPDSVCKAYLKQIEDITRVPLVEVAQGRDKLALEKHVPDAKQSMDVAEVFTHQPAVTAPRSPVDTRYV
jgi:hypothetical protein